MKKIIITLLCFIHILVVNLHVVEAQIEIPLQSTYGIVVDLDNQHVLYEKNSREKMYPASMTKIVTILVALDKIKDLNQMVTIDRYDLETLYETGASIAYFQEGETVTYLDLLYGAMLPSGADACRALARLTYGNMEAFVKQMNQLVMDIGLTNTHFVNPTGIHDDDHYTTVFEMAKIVEYALKNKTFVELFTTSKYTSSNGFHTWNSTLLNYKIKYGLDTDFIVGAKTGYTDEAQMCLAALIDVDGKKLITVVGHGDKNIDGVTILDNQVIKDYVSNHYQMVLFKSKGDILTTIKPKYTTETISFVADEDICGYLPIDYNLDDIIYDYQWVDKKAPLKKGTKVGKMKITYNQEIIYQKDLILKKDVNKDLFGYYFSYVKEYLIYIIAALMLFSAMIYIRKKQQEV